MMINHLAIRQSKKLLDIVITFIPISQIAKSIKIILREGALLFLLQREALKQAEKISTLHSQNITSV